MVHTGGKTFVSDQRESSRLLTDTQVSLTLQWTDDGWALRPHLYQVSSLKKQFLTDYTEQESHRPRASTKSPASMITNDTLEQIYVDNAIKNPKLILVSDWFHMTSEELHENALLANVDYM